MSGTWRAHQHGGTRRPSRRPAAAAVRLHDLSRTGARRQQRALYRGARTAHVRSRAYSGRGFSGSAGRILRPEHEASLHDAAGRAARGRVRPPRRSRRTATWCSTASARRCGRRDSGGCCRSLGFENAAVLDGGLDKWKAEGRAIETGPAKGYQPATFTAKPRSRIFRRQARGACRQQPIAIPSSSMRSARNSTRAWSRAATAGPDACPAAAMFPAATLLDPQTKAFVPLADAEQKFAAQGITRDKRVVAYCGGGISATIDLFLLLPARLRQPHAL